MIHKSDVRPSLQQGPCEKCGEHITLEEDHVLTFYKGSFIILHQECADFIDNAQRGPRTSLTKGVKG